MLAANRDPRRPSRKGKNNGGGKPDVSGSLIEARTVKEHYSARLAKLEYERAIGKLVEASEVKVAAFNRARIVRDALMNIPGRVSPILAAEAEPHKIHEILIKEIRIALEELSRDADRT